MKDLRSDKLKLVWVPPPMDSGESRSSPFSGFTSDEYDFQVLL